MCVVTIIFSMHLDTGKCNSKELYNIIEGLNPEIIFEEFDISRTEDEYYKNGHYKYQKECSVETTAIMNYLEKYKIVHIPVDTYDITYFPTAMYKKISEANDEYDNLFKNIIFMSCEQGFSYTNSIECFNLMERMHAIEEEVIHKLNDKMLFEEYKSWQLITNNRDNNMLKNIYDYSKNHSYNNAIFIIGAEHRKSILDKINDYNSKEIIKINWRSWRIA
jgi:hypothetical protein